MSFTKKADWLIVLSVAIISYALLYFFKLPGPSQPPLTPKQEVVQPEVKKPEVTKPEVKEPETVKPEAPGIVVFEPKKGKVTFNHSKHSEGFACKDCHHKTEQGSIPKKCKECHESTFSAFHSKNSIYSCVGCHKEVGSGPGYTPCSGCHKN